MIRTILALPALCTGLLLPLEAPARQAEAVLDRHAELSGSLEAYAPLALRTSTGTVYYKSLKTLCSLTVHETRGTDRRWRARSEALGDMVESSLGDLAWTWSHMSGARLLGKVGRARVLRDAPIDAAPRWRDLFVEARYLGLDELGGNSVHAIELTPEVGRKETRYYDTESGLHVQTEGFLELEGNLLEATTRYSDYRDCDGVLVPFKIHLAFGDAQELLIELEDVSHADHVPEDLLFVPELVRMQVERG